MNNHQRQPTKDTGGTTHVSFLLRLWRACSIGSLNWQASLEIPGTTRRVGFSSLEQLFAYLMDLTEGAVDTQQKMEEKGVRETHKDSQEL